VSTDLEEVHQTIQRFLATARHPAIVEAGETPIELATDGYAIEYVRGRLTVEAWDRDRHLMRRVTGLVSVDRRRVELRIERFGKRSGTIELIDLATPASRPIALRAGRLAYREQFRRSLLRQFPGWRVAEISADADLERSFSPAYARGVVAKGGTAWAAIGVPADASDADAALTFGLLWLDYVRRRERRMIVEGLAVFLPEGTQRNTCLRLLYLDVNAAAWRVFIYGEGFEDGVDLRDYGNIESSLPKLTAGAHVPAWASEISRLAGVETVGSRDGAVSWRVCGLEFASWDGRSLRFGIETVRKATESNLAEIAELAGELSRVRSPDSADKRNSLYLRNAESWLESRVRGSIATIDVTLLPAPMYSQAPAIVGGHRGVIDLLAVDRTGRLAVVEVKASEDLHLPLQALDYWIRVKWHLDRGEFSASGLFSGVELRTDAPRMLLVAPALHFHPSTESVLQYFPRELEIERIGVTAGWKNELRVAFRVRGAESPASAGMRDNPV
jgi:hypothetical protein